MTQLPENLPSKPLVEVILEVRWGAEGQPDPAYPLIVGRLYERLQGDYPAIEPLQIEQAGVPAEMTIHQVRHRFRRTKGGWPLIQVGPGVITLNETESYRWRDFRERALRVLPCLYESHPSPDSLNITSLLLRYVNAIAFDYSSADALAFLAEKMRVSLSFVPSSREQNIVSGPPTSLGLHAVFPAMNPRGSIILLVGTGKHRGKNALVWEIHFRSVAGEVSSLPNAFPEWLEAAHDTVERWFLEMVKGELLERFSKP